MSLTVNVLNGCFCGGSWFWLFSRDIDSIKPGIDLSKCIIVVLKPKHTIEFIFPLIFQDPLLFHLGLFLSFLFLLSLQLCFLISFIVFHPFLLNFLFFFFVLFYHLSTNIVLDMRHPVHELHEILAVITLVGLTTTHVVMVFPLQELYSFIAEPTRLWLHLALLFMSFKLKCRRFEITFCTNNLLMEFFFMLFFFSLWHTLPTVFALIVLPCTPDIMHPEFRCFNVLLTDRASLCLNSSFGFHISSLNSILVNN